MHAIRVVVFDRYLQVHNSPTTFLPCADSKGRAKQVVLLLQYYNRWQHEASDG
jgi:hypothetical protein